MDVRNNSEEDLIITYKNIKELSHFSDIDDEFVEVLESNYNVRKGNEGLGHISSKNNTFVK